MLGWRPRQQGGHVQEAGVRPWEEVEVRRQIQVSFRLCANAGCSEDGTAPGARRVTAEEVESGGTEDEGYQGWGRMGHVRRAGIY